MKVHHWLFRHRKQDGDGDAFPDWMLEQLYRLTKTLRVFKRNLCLVRAIIYCMPRTQ